MLVILGESTIMGEGWELREKTCAVLTGSLLIAESAGRASTTITLSPHPYYTPVWLISLLHSYLFLFSSKYQIYMYL